MYAAVLLLGLAVQAQTQDLAHTGAYPIGADDVLQVTVYGHDDLTHTVVVGPEGGFVYPLLGRVQAAGLTPRELEQSIALQLARGYVRNPQVAVVVRDYRSRVVYVMGELTRPGTYPLPIGRTLMEVLARAGPMLESAAEEVIVLRPVAAAHGPVPLPPEGDGQPAGAPTEVIRVSLKELESGVVEKNIRLRPSDTVLVPRAAQVFVSGEVRKPGAYPLIPGGTVRQAIILAGGLSSWPPWKRIRIVRTVEGRPTEIKAGMDDRLRPEDTVVVKAGLF